MKLLLVAINAKYIHSNLAVYSLKAYANKYFPSPQKNSYELSLLEYTINHSEEDILAAVYREKAEVVAFSCYIWNIDIILRITMELKKIRPELILWLGGPEVSFDTRKCLSKYSQISGIMIGEGEQTFLELMEYYALKDRALKDIAGIAFREPESGKIVVTEQRQPIAIDTVPFPYEEEEGFEHRIIYYESSRGCPFSCSYCLSSIDRRVRLRSTELVKQELKLLLDRKVPLVKFVDRTFNCNKQHAMEIWRFLKEQDNGITKFHFEISADLLTEDEITLLTTLRPGLVQFEIGVQTTNPDIIDIIGRKMDLAKLKRNVELVRQGGNIHQHLDLIAGLPEEDYASFERSFGEVYYMRPDQLQLGFLKVLKGAPMEAQAKQYGLVYRDTAPYEVLYTEKLSYEEILLLKGICEMVEVYYNSGQFVNAIAYLEHFYASPMKLYEELYHYYEENKLMLPAHSRIRRYEILLSFYRERLLVAASLEEGADEKQNELLLLFEEILVFDFYLREDWKGKLTFRSDKPLHNFKSIYDKYRKTHKQIHIEAFSFDLEASVNEGRPIRKENVLSFDYSNRDPITYSAVYRVLEPEDLQS